MTQITGSLTVSPYIASGGYQFTGRVFLIKYEWNRNCFEQDEKFAGKNIEVGKEVERSLGEKLYIPDFMSYMRYVKNKT